MDHRLWCPLCETLGPTLQPTSGAPVVDDRALPAVGSPVAVFLAAHEAHGPLALLPPGSSERPTGWFRQEPEKQYGPVRVRGGGAGRLPDVVIGSDGDWPKVDRATKQPGGPVQMPVPRRVAAVRGDAGSHWWTVNGGPCWRCRARPGSWEGAEPCTSWRRDDPPADRSERQFPARRSLPDAIETTGKEQV